MDNLSMPLVPIALPGVTRIKDPVPAIAFVLSSGRTFGLTVVRARNRLLEVSSFLKAYTQAPEPDSLVEWVEIYPKTDSRIQYSYCDHSFRSTHALFDELTDVDASELEALLPKADLNALYGELQSYRQRAREERFHILEEPLKWRSRLTEWAESFSGKCSEEQFRNRMLKQPGLRKDERHWHDLVRWLFYVRRPGPVEPSQLGSGFQLRYILPKLYRLVGPNTPDLGVLCRCDRELTKREMRNLPEIGEDSRVVLYHPALGFGVVRFRQNDLLGNRIGWIAVDNEGKSLKQGADITDENIQEAVDQVLFAINRRIKSWALYSDSAQWTEYTVGDSDQRNEYLLVLDDFPHRFINNPHYDVDNVLLHIRTSIHYSRDGCRCLVVDELQSDWLQKKLNQSQNFRDGNDQLQSMPWSSDWYELGLKVILQLASKSQFDAVMIANSGIHKELYGAHFTDGGTEFYDKILTKRLVKLLKPWALSPTYKKLALSARPVTILRTEGGYYEILGAGGENIFAECSSLAEGRKLVASSDLMRDGPEVTTFPLSKEFKNHVNSKGMLILG